MSRVFLPTGEAVAVTYVKVPDNAIVRTKTREKDGYEAIVLGIDEEMQRTRKGKERLKYKNQKEFTVESLEGLVAGGTITLTSLPKESMVTVTGVGKGKGFQGVMKRYHFSGGPKSHGSHFKREPGSVGMRTWPGRIHAGKKLPGQMGGETVTLKHRAIISADETKKMLAVKGPIPGPNGGIVYLTLEPQSDSAGSPLRSKATEGQGKPAPVSDKPAPVSSKPAPVSKK